MRYLSDTNVCLDYLTGRHPEVVSRLQAEKPVSVGGSENLPGHAGSAQDSDAPLFRGTEEPALGGDDDHTRNRVEASCPRGERFERLCLRLPRHRLPRAGRSDEQGGTMQLRSGGRHEIAD